METLLENIKGYRLGNKEMGGKVLEQMHPLVEKYARKIHFMEYEDARQEMYLAVLKALGVIDIAMGEGQCVNYIAACVENRYRRLCKNYLEKNQEIGKGISEETGIYYENSFYEDILFWQTWTQYREKIKNSNKKEIMDLYVINEQNVREISEKIGLSRQYVNRVVKEEGVLFLHYLRKSKEEGK